MDEADDPYYWNDDCDMIWNFSNAISIASGEDEVFNVEL